MKNHFSRGILAIFISLFVLSGLIGSELYSRHEAAQHPVIELTSQNYKERLNNSKPFIYLEFYSNRPDCAPCNDQNPIVNKVAPDYLNRVSFYRVAVENNPELTGLLGIASIPTHVLYNVSARTATAATGLLDETQLRQFIEQALADKAA